MKKVKSEDFEKEISAMLTTYSVECAEISKRKIDEVTKEGLHVLKENAPVKEGDYEKTLAKRKVEETHIKKVNILYAKRPGYSLSHLLEYPHLTRNGSRTTATPHFKYANEYVENNLFKEIGEAISKIK